MDTEKRWSHDLAGPIAHTKLRFDSADVVVGALDAGARAVQVTVLGRNADASDLDISFQESGEGLLVEGRLRANSPSVRPGRLRVEIAVPLSDLDVATESGAIRISSYRADAVLRTNSGGVVLRDCSGAWRAKTDVGEVQVDRFSGRLECKTGAGAIRVKAMSGELRATTGAGEIEASFTQVESSRLKSDAGNIDLMIPAAAGVRLSAASDTGKILFRPAIGGLSQASDPVVIDVNGGGPELSLVTDVGDVVVRRVATVVHSMSMLGPHGEGASLKAGEFLETLNSRAGISIGASITGAVQRSPHIDALFFSPGRMCASWLPVPLTVIESVTVLGRIDCGAHTHELVQLQLKAPSSSEGSTLTELLRALVSANPGTR